MLPSRPNAGRGLPSRTPVRPRNNDYDEYDDHPSRSGRSAAPSSNSAPRSRSMGRPSGRDRERNYDSDDYDRPPASSSSSRQLKGQRSGANLRPGDAYRDDGRSGRPRPPMPSDSRLSTSSAPDMARRSDMSTSTTSSSGASSFLDRLRAGKPGETSSRTSLEEEYEPPKRSRAGAKSGGGRQAERRRGDDDDYYEDDRDRDRDRERSRGGWAPQSRGAGRRVDEDYEDAEPGPSDEQGHGSSLWNTVSSAASNLTINVSKAWETKVATYMGEETPPGSESRLTRAMKAYHLEKARSPSDLPTWLFEESERRARAPPPSSADRRQRDRARGRDRDRFDEEEEYEDAPAPKSRGLRDIYERAAANTPAAPPPSRPQRSFGGSVDEGSGAGGSKAANRLKAMRDAKRAAATTARYDDPPEEDDRYDEPPARPSRRGNRSEDSDARSTPPPPRPARVGLPSGPARRY